MCAFFWMYILVLQGRRKRFSIFFFFLGGGEGGRWKKMSATIVGWRRKIFKKHWLKCPKAFPQKMKFRANYKWFKISYLEFFLWKCYLGHATFLYLSRRSIGHIRDFFNSRFSRRKSQSQLKLGKKITHFTMQLFPYFYP